MALPSIRTGNDAHAAAAPPHADKWRALIERFAGLGRVLVAYSGGIDSTLLMKAGSVALGADCMGVIARSETLTDDEYEAAMAVARAHEFNVRSIEYSELAIENYAENPVNRCYFCKHELYSQLGALALKWDIPTIVEGSNASDLGDWRPGMRAAAELSVISPLRDAGLHKPEIRELAQALGLPNWDKPSSPCLSSRVAYGVQIDRDKLRQIAEGEKYLRGLGFRVVRVRHHGTHARIEVGAAETARLLTEPLRSEALARIAGLGFARVEIDERGYRTGSLNEGRV